MYTDQIKKEYETMKEQAKQKFIKEAFLKGFSDKQAEFLYEHCKNDSISTMFGSFI